MEARLEILMWILSALIAFVIASANYRIGKNNRADNFDHIKEVTDSKDIIELMFDNVKELKEYYTLTKNQAKSTFIMALLSCVLGFSIYLFGIIITVFYDKNIAVISMIGGSVLEIISGTTFWIYNKAITQLDTYHKRLEATERYLIAYQTIEKVPEKIKYEEQKKFIEYVLNDNYFQIKSSEGIAGK